MPVERLAQSSRPGAEPVDLWGEPDRPDGALDAEAADRDRGAALVRRALSVDRPAPCAGDPPRTRDARPLWARTATGRRTTRPLARPRPLAGAAAARRAASRTTAPATPIRFLPVEGEGLHQIPVGPVHAGIIEPGHFRFTCSGETVVRLEERLGYVHKGIEALMRGAALDTAARLAGRISGDSTVAYAIAFARAVEAALGIARARARGLAARRHGRTRTHRQPSRRYRRGLQRRRLRADARALRRAARAGAARRPPPLSATG